MVENLPADAGDTGSRPGLGKSHMPRSSYARAPQLLSPRATTTEAPTPRARAPQQEEPLQWEARAPQQREAPPQQLEKAHAQQRRPNAAKNK